MQASARFFGAGPNMINARAVRSESERSLDFRWRELDSNFQYASAVNLVVSPFGWVVLLRSGAGRTRRFWYSAVSATGLGDLSHRPRGGPPPVGPLVRSIGLDPK